jgi:hypothetical protein
MTFKPASKSSTTGYHKYSVSPTRQQQLRDKARREIPALRKQAEEGISTLKRLADRAGR